jgi:hypothetical protein
VGRPDCGVDLRDDEAARSISVRPYNHPVDFENVGRSLVRTYSPTGNHINWLQPRWEYMHFHPLIAGVDRDAIGVGEAEGTIVAVIHPEHRMGMAFFEVDPGFAHLKPEMLAYAEEYLSVATNERKELRIYINDRDIELQRIATYRISDGRRIRGDVASRHPRSVPGARAPGRFPTEEPGRRGPRTGSRMSSPSPPIPTTGGWGGSGDRP